MTNTTIREVRGDEMLEIMYRMDAYAFHSSPPFSGETEWKEWARQREGTTCLVLFEDGAAVASAVSTAMMQHVRGAMFGMGGIWGVVTHPAARRKGYQKRVLASLLAAIRENGRPLSCLYPFRESFYERLGYATFPMTRKVIFTPLALLPLLKHDLKGEVELALISDGFDTYLDYLRRLQQHIHGMAMFDRADRAAAQRNTSWLATAKVNGEVVGLMLYDLKGERPTEFNMRIFRFYYHSAQGRYLLLNWIARHADQANRVEMWLPSYELPETWLSDLRITTEATWYYPMGRVVDVAKIGGMHSGSGSFSAHVSDPLCPWNEGIWRFQTGDGMLRVSAADKADCDLNIQALAALIYGTHDPGDFVFRCWGNPSSEAQETMRAMFPRMMPYLHESF